MPAIRVRRRRFGRWSVTVAALTVIAFVAVVFVSASSANLTGSNFEGNDGNLVSNGGKDWSGTGANAAPNLSVGVDLPTGQNDNSFGNGTKEDDNTPTVGTGSIPNSKADLARFGVASETIAGHQYLYLAWSRENQSGTVNFDFEINQQAQPSLTTVGTKTLNRQTGDLLINYAFQGGSNTPTLTKYSWTGSSWSQPGVAISSACEEGATNSQTVVDNLGGNAPINRPAQQFGEAAIDLACANIIPANSCESFTSAYVKSRSSTAFTSEIKDFIAPVPISLHNCGKITIKKHTAPRGLNQSFSYTSTGGLSPASFSLNDNGNSSGDSTGNTKVFDSVQPGIYTVTEGADPSGFAFDSVSCSGGSTSISNRTVTINMGAGDDVTCTYVNNQQLGAIKVSKASTKGQALAGATFSVAGQSVQTGTDGTACVDHLAFGSYSVQETAAPAGYAIDDSSSHSVSVNANQDCSTATAPLALQFTDTPKTDITVEARSQVAGGTKSQISCVNAAAADIGDSPSQNIEDAKVSASGVSPGTYTCTIVVDP
jgi:Prealbumin-like fold domain